MEQSVVLAIPARRRQKTKPDCSELAWGPNKMQSYQLLITYSTPLYAYKTGQMCREGTFYDGKSLNPQIQEIHPDSDKIALSTHIWVKFVKIIIYII